MEENNITVNDLRKIHCKHIMSGYKNNTIFVEGKDDYFNPEVLNKAFWLEKKIDRYEKTESRKTFPCEFWYNLKGKRFIGELSKCFKIAKKNNFKSTYDFLMSQSELY